MTAVACSNCGTITDPPRRGMCNRCYENNRYRMNAYGRWDADRVDAAPVRAHVLALIASGMPRKKVARSAGIADQSLTYILRGRSGHGPAKRVTHATAAALLGVQPDSVASGEEFVSALGSQRRLRALVASGWTITSLAQQLGCGTRSDLAHLMYRQKLVRAWKREQIAALYSRLQLIPGPSVQARKFGASREWPLPFQWDEDAIDDPRGRPHRTRRKPFEAEGGAA